jgi:hypothetical protein
MRPSRVSFFEVTTSVNQKTQEKCQKLICELLYADFEIQRRRVDLHKVPTPLSLLLENSPAFSSVHSSAVLKSLVGIFSPFLLHILHIHQGDKEAHSLFGLVLHLENDFIVLDVKHSALDIRYLMIANNLSLADEYSDEL